MIAPRINPRVLRVIVLLSIAVLALLLFLFFRKTTEQKFTGNLTVSDTRMSNASSAMISGDSLLFFTGSNLASTSIESLKGDAKTSSKSLLSEVPYDEIRDISIGESGKSLLVKFDYSSVNTFLSIKGRRNGLPTWVLQREKVGPILFEPLKDVSVVDAIIDGNVIYALTYKKENTSSLIRYTIATKKYETILGDTSSTKIAGTTKDAVVLQDYKGGVFTLNKTSRELEQVGKESVAYVDNLTNAILVTDTNKQKGVYTGTLHIDGKKRKIKYPGKYVFVSGGYIVSLDKTTRPSDIWVINQKTGKVDRLSSTFINQRSQDSISDVLVTKTDPIEAVVVTGSDQILFASTNAKIVDDLPLYRYPTVNDSSDQNVSFVATKGTNFVTIFTNPNYVQQSLKALSEACSCDINQLTKTWVESIDYNDTQVGEYTGDGTPPEQR